MREAAGRLGIALVNAPVATPVVEQSYRSTFETLKQDHADGLVFSVTLRAILDEVIEYKGWRLSPSGAKLPFAGMFFVG
jgi:hypothetical protein